MSSKGSIPDGKLDANKVKSHIFALRQALQEEQSSSRSLKECLEERNQMVRRIQQETDSLTFRNQQLTKRVEFLQHELSKNATKGSANKQKTQQMEFPDVLEDELRSKIEENARLASQVADLHRSHGEEVSRLRQRVIELEHQVKETMLRSQSIESISSKKESDTESLHFRPQTLRIEQEENHLKSRIEAFQNQVLSLEKEKEMWKLNYQLLTAKQQRSIETDESPSSSKLISPSDVTVSDVDEVRKFFLVRLGQLVTSAQLADSKAAFLHSECTALQERIDILRREKEVTDRSLSQARSEVDSLRSELQTTLLNYETQMNTMSEHMASIVDQLAAKQEENDALKGQLTSRRRIS